MQVTTINGNLLKSMKDIKTVPLFQIDFPAVVFFIFSFLSSLN